MLFLVLIGVITYLYNFYGIWSYHFKECDNFISNPYQGVYVQIDVDEIEEIDEKREKYEDHNLIMYTFNLDGLQEAEEIPKEKLSKLKNGLQYAQKEKIGIIFRAAYHFEGEYKEPEFEVVLSHIKQMGIVLNQYKDCIAGVQAGMLGPYGEWHSSIYMEGTEYYPEVAKAWLEILDQEINVGVRRQEFLRQIREKGIEDNRIGIYNDGLFASESDLGTYRGGKGAREKELNWTNNNIKNPFNGGEMPTVSEFSSIDNVVSEAEKLHLSYLNRYYSKEVWEQWMAEEYNGMTGEEYLKKYLGVRPWIEEILINKNFNKSPHVKGKIILKNSGFSWMSSPLKAFILLKMGDEIREYEADIELGGKEEGTINFNMENPFWKKHTEMIKFGVKIIRGDDEVSGFELKLANDEIFFDKGINWVTLLM